MAADFDTLAQPVSDSDPSGPDLEEQMDADYLAFTTKVEGLLPTDTASFFEFRGAGVELEDEIAACTALLGRSRDLRLVFILAKLVILSGDIDALTGALKVMHTLLDEQWESVHPQPFDGDQTMRMVTLERLDERASIELPLQCAPLVADRITAFNYRDHLSSSGEIEPREGESARSEADVTRISQNADVASLVARRDTLAELRDTLAAIRAVWSAKADSNLVLEYKRLPPLLAAMTVYLDKLVAARDPSLALGLGEEAGEDGQDERVEGAAGDAGPARVGNIANAGDARAALGALAQYFRQNEPSSPARLLVKQAEQLVGVSFLEALRALAPDKVSEAAIKIEGVSVFNLNIETLGGHLDAEGYEYGDEEPPEPAHFEVNTRAEATALLGEVARWYRQAEPSSPIPALCERAQRFASRDFATIFSEVTPPPPQY